MQPEASLLDLPTAVIETILAHLADRDLLLVSTLSRRLRAISLRPRATLDEEELAERGDLPRLMAIGHWEKPSKIVQTAAANGHLNLLRYAIDRAGGLSPSTTDEKRDEEWVKAMLAEEEERLVRGREVVGPSIFYQEMPLPDLALYWACRGGHREIIPVLVNRYAACVDYAFIGACAGGHIDLAKDWAKDLPVFRISEALDEAAAANQVEAVRYTLSLHPDRLFSSLNVACSRGFLDIIPILLDYPLPSIPTSYPATIDDLLRTALCSACSGGHHDVITLLIERGASYFNGGALAAAFANHVDVIERMFALGADNLNSCLYDACMGFSEEAVRALIKMGAGNLPEGTHRKSLAEIICILISNGTLNHHRLFGAAILESCLPIAELLAEHPSANLEQCLIRAVSGNSPHFIRKLIGRGATNIHEALCHAVECNRLAAAVTLIEAGATNFDESIQYWLDRHAPISWLIRNLVVRMLIRTGRIVDLNLALTAACRIGDLDLVGTLIGKGAIPGDIAIEFANATGNVHLQELIGCRRREETPP